MLSQWISELVLPISNLGAREMGIKQEIFPQLPEGVPELSLFDSVESQMVKARILDGEVYITKLLCIDRNTEVVIHENSPWELGQQELRPEHSPSQYTFFSSTVPCNPILNPAAISVLQGSHEYLCAYKAYGKGKA